MLIFTVSKNVEYISESAAKHGPIIQQTVKIKGCLRVSIVLRCSHPKYLEIEKSGRALDSCPHA